MRLMLAIAPLAFGLASFAGCASSSSQSADFNPTAAELQQEKSLLTQTTPIASNTATLEVHGLSCPKCATNVDLTLAEVTGVQRVEKVDLSSGQVKLAFTEHHHPTPAALAHAVKDAGYTLIAIRTP